MKQFNKTAILTSKNPEAFLNFTYDASEYWILPDCCIGDRMLYVNGLDINDYSASIGYALKLDETNNIASFHVYSDINYKFDSNLTFKFYDIVDFSTGTTDVSIHDVSILNRPYIVSSGEINTYDNDDILVDDHASYMILRTNPKFTGNIVLCTDSSSNLFLDTFKVSDILSNKKYRKQKVSGNSVLSSDIRNVFSSMPLGEIYKVSANNTLSIATPKTEYKDQFDTTYNYGARLLKDELYIEDNGLLAPLWINSKLPDYFAVFRLDGVYNTETYDDSSISLLAFNYLENSDIIKSWSIKDKSPLGKYLATHMNDVVKIPAPVFLSLTDPSANQSDPNSWYGIAIDKGVITGRSETTYFFDKKSNNFTGLNAFLSQGFERNNLLCPNLINLQFIFSDDDVSVYTMNRYFGLYLTENVLYEIAYYSDTSGGSVEILSLDDKDSSVFMNSAIFDSSGNVVDNYANRIFVLNNEIKLERIINVNQINDSSFNSYVSKPYENIFSTDIVKTNNNPFITLTLNTTLEQGEHLRIINKTQNKIWEIYSVDASNYNCQKYCTISEDPSNLYPTVYRTYFDINGTVVDQIREIEEAINRFSDYPETYFRAGIRRSNWVSIILNDDADLSEEWAFQRLTACTLTDFDVSSSGFNSAALPSDITFFGRFTPDSSDFEILSYDASFGPIDFELFGNRQSIMLDFINRGNNNLYSFDASENILDKFEEPTLYQDTSLWYRKIIDFDVSNNSYQYVKDPLSIKDKVLIMTNANIKTVSNKLNAYSIYPLNISLMGINPVKDIDYNVYDISLGFKSEYSYKREDDVSSYKIYVKAGDNYNIEIMGSFVIESGNGYIEQKDASLRLYSSKTLFNTFDNSVNLSAVNNTIATYAILDGSYNYKALKDGSAGSEENIYDYYDSSTLLKYGLIVPVVSKWVSLGTDCRNNSLRLILNNNILDVSSNFICDDYNFTQEISYPSFKYLTPGEKAWESYIFYDINDVIYDSDASTYLTFKEAMFEYPYIDYFSKLVYSNYNVDAKKTRSSIVYHNLYKDTINVIFMGLSFSFKVQNVAKNVLNIKNYDRYRFSFISSPSKNKSNKRPIEVIINENTKTILMIWYQGNDELNYNMRYSSYLPGKSLIDPLNRGFVTGTQIDSSYYSFVKTPYYVNNSTIQKSLINLYGAEPIYDNDTTNRYAQLNKNLSGFSSIWNAPGTNNSISFAGSFITDASLDTYNTFTQYVDYVYAQNAATYGNYVINYGYNYTSNANWYTSNTTNIATLKYLLASSRREVMYYIIRGDKIYNSYDFGNVNPIIITINSPKTYRDVTTYNGWFKPKFNSILNFKADEENELVNIVDRGFIFSNTNLRTYSNIGQLWYNKLVSEISIEDISTGNAISYVSNFNVFKSLWDASYYIKDSSYINGYESSYELPSFFGSKLPKLSNEIILDEWDTTTAIASSTQTEITLTFNLTRVIINKFKTSIEFLSNWAGLTNADNYIDQYIKDTILSYYNIGQSKIKVDFYYKSLAGLQILHYSYISSLIHDNKQNFNGQLLYENGDYLYKIIVPKLAKYSYYIKFIITEK